MRHVKAISRTPARAQSICDNLDNDYQAFLCFFFEFLVAFILPLVDVKTPTATS